MCLVPYPLRFRIKEFNKIYELFDYKIASDLSDSSDYLVLESLDYNKGGKNFKLVHVVKLFKDEISIGRDPSSDIFDPELFISQKHAVLKYNKEKGYVTIENRSEKYRSLVLIKGNIVINEKIGFQVGKSCVTACMIEKNM